MPDFIVRSSKHHDEICQVLLRPACIVHSFHISDEFTIGSYEHQFLWVSKFNAATYTSLLGAPVHKGIFFGTLFSHYVFQHSIGLPNCWKVTDGAVQTTAQILRGGGREVLRRHFLFFPFLVSRTKPWFDGSVQLWKYKHFVILKRAKKKYLPAADSVSVSRGPLASRGALGLSASSLALLMLTHSIGTSRGGLAFARFNTLPIPGISVKSI